MREVQKKRKGFLALWVAFALVIALAMPAAQSQALAADGQPENEAGTLEEKEGRTIRVGFFPLGKFMYYNEDNEPAGYNVDYLNKIAQTTHWKYKYVRCNNWTEATQLLRTGKIDLLAPAQITDALRAEFDYASSQLGVESAAIYTLAKRDDLEYEDFEAMANVQFGTVKDSTFAKKFVSEYAPSAGFTPKITEYDTMTDLLQALKDKKIDAAVTNVMFADEAYKLLGQFCIMPVYYIAQKGDTKTLRELDDAMTSLMVADPSFQTNLESSYFPIFNITKYTHEERTFISEIPEITIGYGANRSPISYTDENGKFCGITRDILDQISETTGIKFRYVELPSGVVSLDYLQKNHVNLIADVEYNDTNGNVKQMSLTKPYLTSDKVFVGAKNVKVTQKSKMTVAILSGSQTQSDEILAEYPNFTIQEYDTIAECYQAIHSGKADLLMQNRYVVEPLLSKPAYNNYQVIPVQAFTDELSLAVIDLQDETTANTAANNALFLSVLDKSISRISTQKRNNIIISNTSNRVYHYTAGDFIYQYWLLIVLVLMIFALLVILDMRRRKTSLQLEGKNRQLSMAVEEAKEANSAKSQFLAQMSHEIRTPMNAIIGLTTIAKNDTTSPEKMDNYLMKIDGSSRLLLGIINDVLDMSAIESNKLKIDSAPFDFKQLIFSITTVFYQQTKQKGVDFEVRMKGVTEEMLVGDQLRVNQILMNLLSNAVKFTPSGGHIDLMIVQASRNNDKVYLRFSVTDTGCGMSEEMLGRLFNPFEQESASTARKHGGSGLGLSITKNLVTMMGGSIKVDSKKDFGSCFTVDLPFGVTQVNGEEAKKGFGNVRALVIDDDQDSCEYTQMLLERLGVRSDYVLRGEEGLEALGEAEDAEDPYHLCIVDWKMPEMDGVAVTQKIREIFGESSVIVIASAYDLNEVEAEGKRAGADYFIPKPLFQSSIFNILAQITGESYAKVEGTGTSSYDISGHTVLVAEDVALNMEVAVKILDLAGVKAECAEDGQQALKMYEKQPVGYYDAILLDINMPVMDGYEAARAIRKSEKEGSKEIPIYAMTANAFSEDVSAAMDAGMNGHIAKPIETDVLYRTLQSAFEDKK